MLLCGFGTVTDTFCNAHSNLICAAFMIISLNMVGNKINGKVWPKQYGNHQTSLGVKFFRKPSFLEILSPL